MAGDMHVLNRCSSDLQTMLLYLVGTVDRLPPASPLLKGTRLPIDSILEGAGLVTGQKSAAPRLSPAHSSMTSPVSLWRLQHGVDQPVGF